MKTLSLCCVCCVTALVFWAGASNGNVTRYLEDFTTTQSKDMLNTTAWWDTVAGELKLFPFVPTLAGTCDTPDNAWGVYVSGDHAFVADYYSGLQVIDISNPAAPALVGTYDTPHFLLGIFVSGDYAFVADAAGLQVIDISNPTTPTLIGTCYTPGTAVGICVSGDHAFLADNLSGFQVIDISDPAAPTLVGTCDTPGNAYKVYVSGDYAFVADYESGLQVIDISDPAAPTLVGTYDTPGEAWGIYVSGNYAFVGDRESGLQVIDISNPAVPTLAGTYDTPDYTRGVFVSGDYAFLADEQSGLQVIDITNPAAPTLAGTYDTPDNAMDIYVSGDHAFVADASSGLQVITISNPVPPMLVGTYYTPGESKGVRVSGNHAFVADGIFGFQVIDISDPAAPTLLGTYDTPGSAFGVYVSGDHAFVADYGSGLQVIDISDPAAPTLAGTYDTPGSARDVYVSGDHAFVADYGSGLQVIDISDPAAPTLAGTYDTPDNAWGVYVSGDYAFVADFESGLQVIDISNPSAPTLAGTCDTPDNALGVYVSGDYAFVADGGSGLQVIDISNPSAPTLAGAYDTPGVAYKVYISGDQAFVADGASGLQVIDITTPAAPTLLWSYDTPGTALGVYVSGKHAFVADGLPGSPGVQVIQVFQSEVDLDNNVGRSLAVDALNDTIFWARLTAIKTDSVAWELSADGGMSWQEFEPDGSWNQLIAPGIDLVWRSTHTVATAGAHPCVTQLKIDWRYDFPVITFAEDIPNDQGGCVLLEWNPSCYDAYDQRTVTHYSVWRALHAVPSAMPENAGPPLCTPADIVEEFQGPAYRVDQEYYWEWLSNITAQYFDGYAFAAPTYYDSTGGDPAMHYFQVIAHTSDQWVFWTSYVDSGYSVDNLAPCVPQGFAVAYNTGSGNALSWEESLDEDFQYFCIYRSTNPDFTPSPGDLIHTTVDVNWSDPEYDGWNVYYKITAVDYAGNESDAASAGTVTGDDTPTAPGAFALYQNAPNPFNPTTMIRFDLPVRSHARLSIYNVKGQLVRVLLDREIDAGCREVRWDGRDSVGRGVASGIYFYRLDTQAFSESRKMILLR